jgi:hypothetical protein
MANRLYARRAALHVLKRAVSRDGSAEAMLALLLHSVQVGHKKLALMRCLQAERMGVSVPLSTLAYCQLVADSMPATQLEKLVLRQAPPQ